MEARNALARIKDSQIGPDPEVIVVTGDMVENKYVGVSPTLEAQEQGLVWGDITDMLLEAFWCAQIVAVPGNHDYCTYDVGNSRVDAIEEADTFNVHGVKFTGFRGIPKFRNQWNGEYSEKQIAELLEQCDPKADVLVTHTPARKILDRTRHGENAGSVYLKKWLKKSRVKLHCFGHIHEARGTTRYYRNRKDTGTTCSNASLGWNWLSLG